MFTIVVAMMANRAVKDNNTATLKWVLDQIPQNLLSKVNTHIPAFLHFAFLRIITVGDCRR